MHQGACVGFARMAQALALVLLFWVGAVGSDGGEHHRRPWQPIAHRHQHQHQGRGGGRGGFWRDCSDPAWGCSEGIWWNKRQLGRALLNTNYLQMEPLFAKLRRGEPITVAALGSSITAFTGGSFHRSLAALASKVAQIPSRYLRFSQPQHQNGWLAEVMRAINHTHPHPDHTLLVNARAAWTLERWSAAACLENTLPRSMDLLILENVGQTSPTLDIEWLIQRIFQHLKVHGQCRPPAVIFVYTQDVAVHVSNEVRTRHVRDGASGFPWGDHACPPSPAGERVGEQVHTIGRGSYEHQQAGPVSSWLPPEAQWASLLDFYGFGSVSARNFWFPLLRENFHRTMGMSACELVRTVSEDGVHPGSRAAAEQNRTNPGYQLFADLVMNYLDNADRYLRSLEPEGEGAGGEEGVCPEWPFTMNTAERFVAGRSVEIGTAQRCYGVDGAVAATLDEAQTLFEDYGNPDNPGRDAAAQQYQRELMDYFNNASLTNLQVVRNTGWEFVLHNQHGATTKMKPGWVASEAGAELHIEVNSVFEAVPDNRVTMNVEYLQSYEHMGKAKISCASGCECESEVVVDALAPEEKISVAVPATLRVTQAEACVVSVRVLEETSSGEHKFKVVMVTLDSGTNEHLSLKLDQ